MFNHTALNRNKKKKKKIGLSTYKQSKQESYTEIFIKEIHLCYFISFILVSSKLRSDDRGVGTVRDRLKWL